MRSPIRLPVEIKRNRDMSPLLDDFIVVVPEATCKPRFAVRLNSWFFLASLAILAVRL
jgi:hypothetical protein